MRSIVVIILLAITGFNATAQVERPMNLQNFDGRKYHFGFMLGYNSSSFYLDLKKDYPSSDSILAIHQNSQPGFDLIIVSSLNVTPNINFRFTPGLSFQDRWVDYTFKDTILREIGMRKTVGSTYLNFPLLMKLRTNRINNCDVYAIGGYFYGLDMANNRDFENDGPLTDHAIRLTKADHGYMIGGGMDFYLRYFKFGFEIKLHAGVKNILLQDNTFFMSPFDVIKSRCWTFALTFEG